MAKSAMGPVTQREVLLPGVRKRARPVTINVAQTQYSIVKDITQSLGWRLSVRAESWDWDVLWTDTAVTPDTLTRMKPYQKINHFPGTYMITRKNLLGRNLNKMRKVHPAEYSFYPRTWVLPADFAELKGTNLSMYIVKPEASCQGKGIYLTRSLDELTSDSRCVVQEYVKAPLLIDGFKFDMRIYVLLAGCSPLRAFIHQEGLVRLATNQYSVPTAANLHQQCMHLTNYAINKTNQAFVQNEDPTANEGHKRSLSSLWSWLQKQGCNTSELWAHIKCIVAKTLVSIQPSLAHTYKACQPSEPSNGMCFELLGFDILLDSTFKPWLLEVNHSPSFSTDSQLDVFVKGQVIRETFTILNVNSQAKQQYQLLRKARLQQSIFPRNREEEREQRLSECLTAQNRRDEWELSHLGHFEKVATEEQEQFCETAHKLWERWTGPTRVERPVRPVTQCLQRRFEPPQSPAAPSRETPQHSRQESPHHSRRSELPRRFHMDLFRPGRTSPAFQDILQEKRVLQAVQRHLMAGTHVDSTPRRPPAEMLAKLDLTLGNYSRIAKRRSWHSSGITK